MITRSSVYLDVINFSFFLTFNQQTSIDLLENHDIKDVFAFSRYIWTGLPLNEINCTRDYFLSIETII